jgi:hypothetical protein
VQNLKALIEEYRVELADCCCTPEEIDSAVRGFIRGFLKVERGTYEANADAISQVIALNEQRYQAARAAR